MKQRLLIWFRRFRPQYGRKFRFHRALAEACSGLAYPITVQDSSYPSTILGSFLGRGWFILPAAFGAFIVGMLAVMLASVMLLPEKSAFSGFVAGTVLLAVAGVFLTLKAYRRLGYRRFSGPGAGHQVLLTLDSIKAGGGNFLGVDVFQCDDAAWQAVVAASLTMADVAVVDVSEVTENLAWEISQALKSLPPERVIFVCEERSSGAAGSSTDFDRFFSGIEPRLDIEKLKDEMIVFPSEWAGPGFGLRRQVAEFSQRLRLELADRLLHD